MADWWSETTAIACWLAHDQGLADIEDVMPRRRDRISDRQAYFATIAHMAQTPDEPPITIGTLLRHGLLPTTCSLSAPAFRRRAAVLHWSLERGDAARARDAMQSLTASCSFAICAPTDRD